MNRFKCKKKFVPECGRTCCIEAMSVHLFCNNKLHVLALLTNIRLHMMVKLFLSALFRGSTGTGTGTPVATLILLFLAGWTLLSCLFTLGEESPGPLDGQATESFWAFWRRRTSLLLPGFKPHTLYPLV